MSDIEIRRAEYNDLGEVMALYRRTQQWLAAKGSDQWQPKDGRNDVLLERVRTNLSCSIERGECYVALRGDRVVGTITVDEFADPEFWRPTDDPGSALYLHRMIVDRSTAGAGVSDALLRLADDLAAKYGRPWLRLDAWRTNTPLHRYYQRQGFAHVRTVDLPHRGSGALFQRPVARRA
jgi:GNAT superfamily N-acetyltransferase